MANPRITFNSKNADFTKDVDLLQVTPIRVTTRSQSTSGHPGEVLNIASGFSVRAVIARMRNSDATEGDLKTALYEASMWAESGQAWTFARDSALVVNTTLDAAVAAAAVSLPVASATGIVSGSRYALESDTNVAIVEASNSATDPVTITVGLNAAFASGSRLRYFEYLPMVGSIRIVENSYGFGLFYDVEIIGSVDKRAL